MQISKLLRKAGGNLGGKVSKFLSKRAHIPYVGPISLWIIFFVVAPLGFIIYFSFLTTGPLGTIIYTFTLENYQALFQIDRAEVLLRTLLYASVVNMICLLVGYPLAYFIVRYAGRWQTILLFFVVLPSWTSYLIRLYAIRMLMGYSGLINSTLLSLGLISSPLGMLYTPYAVVFGLAYAWLPFMVLPIYASLKGLDPSLLEASIDLGATPFRRFLTVTLPLTKGGIIAGTILVFIPTLGAWLIPMILGGGGEMMAGNLVALHFIGEANIPLGSSIASVLTAIVILIMYLSIKLGGEKAFERLI